MKKNILARVILSMAMVVSVIGFVPGAQAHHAPVHQLHVSGISTILNMCEYVPMKDGAGNVIKDELGISRPSTLPPTCVKNADGTDRSCDLVRNLNPAPGAAPPCAGNLSANDDSFAVGCVDALSPSAVQCSLRAPTWFYGYCGQTYGGASSGTYTIGGVPYTIEKMGFTRGRGAWEFSGRMNSGTGESTRRWFRMYLAAVPDKTDQTAGCDVTKNIKSVLFAGTMTIYGSPFAYPATMPVKMFRTSPGWHYCDDDFGPGGTVTTPTATTFKAGALGDNC